MTIRPNRPIATFRPLAEINVTPLVDVMLVLLVVFVITAPMLAAGLKVDLPATATARPLPPPEPLVVTVTRDGSTALGTDVVPRDELVAAIRARLATGAATETKTAVHVRGDRDAPYGDVLAVIDHLAAAGLTHIALVSQVGRPPLGEAAR